jgi:hypothetical protein
MKDFVSRANLLLVSASLMIVTGIFFADLPWVASLFVSVAAAAALWMTPGTQPARALAPARHVPRAPHTRI